MPSDLREVKDRLRTGLLAARRAVPTEVREATSRALADQVSALVRTLRLDPGGTVCGYLAVGSEPGSAALLDVLRAAGHRVLLPVVVGAAPLDWAEYTGPDGLRAGPHGLREPAGPRLGPDALGGADLVLVPALAVDRSGVRLGKGGGHYDRSLPLVRPGVPVVAVVRDAELVPALPVEPHDVRMVAAVTPDRVVWFGTPR